MATHTFPALDTNNVFTGTNTFAGVSALNNIQFVDGVINTTVAGAIAALSGTGGVVYVPPGTYIGPASIPSNTAIISLASHYDSGVAASLNITYGSPHTQVTFIYSGSLNLTNVQNVNIQGITFDFQNLGGLVLTSSSFCTFNHCSILHGGATAGNALQLTTSGAGGANNTVLNLFEDLAVHCNQSTTPTVTAILLGSGSTAAVTQNRFDRVVITGSPNICIDIEKNTDTNYFHDVMFNQDAPNPGTAVFAFNNITPASDQDSDGNTFDDVNVTGSWTYFIQAGQSTGNVIRGDNGPYTYNVLGSSTPSFTREKTGLNGNQNDYTIGGRIFANATPASLSFPSGGAPGDIIAARSSNTGVLNLGTDGGGIARQGNSLMVNAASGPGAIIIGGGTPSAGASAVAIGGTVGFGAGSAGTAVTTTTKGAGTGPTTPQTIVNYLQINVAGTTYYIPLVQ